MLNMDKISQGMVYANIYPFRIYNFYKLDFHDKVFLPGTKF